MLAGEQGRSVGKHWLAAGTEFEDELYDWFLKVRKGLHDLILIILAVLTILRKSVGLHHAIDYGILKAQALHIATRWFLSELSKEAPFECDLLTDGCQVGVAATMSVTAERRKERKRRRIFSPISWFAIFL